MTVRPTNLIRRLLTTACVASTLTLAFGAHAQNQTFNKPEDAIKYRQSAFKVIEYHFGQLGAMAQGRLAFDAKTAKFHADTLAVVAQLPFTAFPAGSENGETRAMAKIWTDKANFELATQKLTGHTAALQSAAAAGDVAKLKAAFSAVGPSCKSCHDSFRKQQ